METTQLLPPSRLTDSALLSTLDAVDAALSTLNTYHLQLLADLDQRGLATEHGAHDTIEFLSLRHNRNRREIRRDLKTTKALSKYSAVTAALPDPAAPTDSDSGAVPGAARLSPAQAEAIVTTLEKAPASVPDELLRVAEEQMIEVARSSPPTIFGVSVERSWPGWTPTAPNPLRTTPTPGRPSRCAGPTAV
ncbi:hypothetical protein [Kribbella sp. NPDC023855]|uniref:hypothetical protein n=1 Tax=Kribbella sp. NPDC023855 TaxID=3154698 RepID=UPI0033C3B2D5